MRIGRGETLREALTAEALGMSPEEFAVAARPPTDLWRHFGFGALEPPSVVQVAP